MNAGEPRLPRPARWLLHLSPMARDTRDEVEADLLELFVARRDRGAIDAHWRLYRDLASLWRRRATGARSRFAVLRDARADVRYAARLFARQPATFLLAIAGLSLGLGIATAAFSIMNAATLRGEGLVDSSRAPGVLRVTDRSLATSWRYDEFLRLREGATRMQVEALLTESATVRAGSGDEAAPSANVAFVSGGFFAATGGRAALGRVLAPADERDVHLGSPPAVVSFDFWTSRLDRDPAAIGRTIRVGRTAATIVGVAEEGFSLPGHRLLWMPLTAYGAVYDASPIERTPQIGVQVFGRLPPRVSRPEAEAQLSGVAAALPRPAAAGDSAVRVRLDPHAGLGRLASSDAIGVAVFVFAVIGLVLVLACANVATVLVSTAISREREMGVRAALGASRGRIVRQLIAESLLLGAIAAGLGLLLAAWSLPTIGRMIEAPAGTTFTPDVNVYLFLAAVTLLTGVGAGLAPALHGRGVDLVTPIKGAGARTDRVAPRRLRSLLIVTQAAVSVLLIVLASLFVRAGVRTAAIDVGFAADGLYAVAPGLGTVFGDPVAAARTRNFWARAIPELRAVPGLDVTLAELTPFGGISRLATAGEGPGRAVIQFNRIRPEYFDVLGLRLLAGRTFTAAEIAAKAPVAVVSRSLARAYWHGASPLGQLLPPEIPVLTAAEFGLSGARPLIVGVVSDAITARLHERETLAVYEPLDPASEGFAELLIRAAPETGAIDQARQRLRSIDAHAEVSIASVAARVRQEASRPRMLAALTAVVGAIAIFLCVIGLYGLTASVVGQRSREMGVRVAMGAEPRDLLRLLMWDSLRPVVFGLAAGAGASLLASRAVAASVFFGVSPRDPIAFAGAAAILLAAAMLAIFAPTRRAARADPLVVLRQP